MKKAFLLFLSFCCLAPLHLAQEAEIRGASTTASVKDAHFSLPTESKLIFEGKKSEYYMYCDRTFEGETSQPWEAGTFGFTRNPFRTSEGKLMFSRLHEGIDVAPIKRDANSEPLDLIHPIAPGVVVYVSDKAGASNYGRYVVVGHRIPEGIIFTLYAHLAKVNVAMGDTLERNSIIGVLGYTGVGLNKRRAHLHLEICLMINSKYDTFMLPPQNRHGLYNGRNLIGINPEDVLKHCQGGKTFSLSAYLKKLPVAYKVRVPYNEEIDILRRHPFLYMGKAGEERPPSLDIHFSAEGIPLGFYPCKETVRNPQVTFARALPTLQQNCTANRVKGNSKKPELTNDGRSFIHAFLNNKPAEKAQ